MPSASDYPYSPEAQIHQEHGLDKLRAVKDRALAELLCDLYQQVLRNERDPASQRWLEAERRSREREEMDRINALGDRALAGGYGPDAVGTAHDYLLSRGSRRTDISSLREFEAEFRKHNYQRVEQRQPKRQPQWSGQ